MEDLGVDGRLILNTDLQEMGRGSMDRIYLAQDRNRWQGLLKVVVSIRVP
jgi:hypothetical protein